MTPLFQRAQRTQRKLRLALEGPSGSGKTMSALLIAKGLAGGDLSKVCVIDTEHASASLYADLGPYSVLTFNPPYSAERYIKAVGAAVEEGFEVVVIDSFTHAWSGEGGILEYVDQVAKSRQGGNSFSAWQEGTPLHNRLVSTILQLPIHVIATMRAKTEWVLETNSKGKQAPRKVGMGADQRKGTDFEFDLVITLSQENIATATKHRTGELWRDRMEILSERHGEELLAWLNEGNPQPPRESAPVETPPAADTQPVSPAPDPDPAATVPSGNGDGPETLTQNEARKLREVIIAKGRTEAAIMAVLSEKYGLGDGEHLESVPGSEYAQLLAMLSKIPDPEPPTPADAAPASEPQEAANEAQAAVTQETAATPAETPAGTAARPSGCTLDTSFMQCTAIKEGREPQCGECRHFDASWAPLDEGSRRDPQAPAAAEPRKKGSITEPQLLRVVKQTAELEELGVGREEWRAVMREKFGVEHRDELVKTTTAPKAIDYFNGWIIDLKSGVIGSGERAIA